MLRLRCSRRGKQIRSERLGWDRQFVCVCVLSRQLLVFSRHQRLRDATLANVELAVQNLCGKCQGNVMLQDANLELSQLRREHSVQLVRPARSTLHGLPQVGPSRLPYFWRRPYMESVLPTCLPGGVGTLVSLSQHSVFCGRATWASKSHSWAKQGSEVTQSQARPTGAAVFFNAPVGADKVQATISIAHV